MGSDEDIHCCREMAHHLSGGELAVSYTPYLREYGIDYRHKPDSVQIIRFCPWCGKSLPHSLREAWGESLDKIGLFDPFGNDRESVPIEYWSDAWWRD